MATRPRNTKPKIIAEAGITRVALYMRVSTEEQGERGTIEVQQKALRDWAALQNQIGRAITVVDEYMDDGFSGTYLLHERPEGRRLLEDAKAGRFDLVVFFNVKRLGRTLAALLDAHRQLDTAGVAIQSISEPFDTSQPIGRFMFQLFGSMAELDRSSLVEQLALGRDRHARAGEWNMGPVPMGYDRGSDGQLVPSTRLVEPLGLTEPEFVRDLFRRIAAGSTTVAEAQRLTAMEVPRARRYPKGIVHFFVDWTPHRINTIIRCETYRGRHVFKSRFGPIERTVVPLVDTDLWQAANDRLVKNRNLSKKNAKNRYLLRGLIKCECGYTYVGGFARKGGIQYRCGAQLNANYINPERKCRGKIIAGERLERAVWADCRAFILDPGAALVEAQAQLRGRLEQATHVDADRRRLLQQITEKDAERERVLTLFRRGRVSIEDAEAQFDQIAEETASLRKELDGLQAQSDLARAWESRLTDAAVMLGRLRDRLAEIEATDDWDAKREIVELLVSRIVVRTEGERFRKTATLTAHYVFGGPSTYEVGVKDVVATGNSGGSQNNCNSEPIGLERDLVLA